MNPHRIRQQLHRIAESRLALSTVVTSLIILVIAVLLAGVVTYFAVNVTSTRAQEESLALTKQHLWFDRSTEKAQAAIMVINAGGRDVAIDKLTVRGQVCAWSKVYYTLIDGSVTGDLSYSSSLADGASISVGGQNRVFTKATNDLTVQSGKTLIIYMDNPDSIGVNDVGLTVSVNIFTSQAMYYKETNVQGTSTSNPSITSTIDILYAAAWAPTTGGDGQVALIVKNVGSSVISFTNNNIQVKGQISNAFVYGAVDNFDATNDLPFDGSVEIQGYEIESMDMDTVIIPSGYTAIIYITAIEIVESDLGENITIAIVLNDGQTDSIQVNVQAIQIP